MKAVIFSVLPFWACLVASSLGHIQWNCTLCLKETWLIMSRGFWWWESTCPAGEDTEDSHSVKMLPRYFLCSQTTSRACVWLCSMAVLCLSRAGDHWPWPKMCCQLCLDSYNCFFPTCCSVVVRIKDKMLFPLLLVLIFYCRLLYGVFSFSALKFENVSCWREKQF